jgi:hypothetical protein
LPEKQILRFAQDDNYHLDLAVRAFATASIASTIAWYPVQRQ